MSELFIISVSRIIYPYHLGKEVHKPENFNKILSKSIPLTPKITAINSLIRGNSITLDSIRARDLDQGEEEEEGEAGKSGLNLISK